MEQLPTVSVIIPCFNQAKYLPDALDSLIAQTHPSWECIIVDDGSTDDTSEVAGRYASGFPAIRAVRQDHAGTSAARNRGLQEASGAYIQFLDADDLLEPSKIQKQFDLLSRHPGLAVCLCDYSYTDPHGSVLPWHQCYRPPELDTDQPQQDLALRWETELSVPIHCFLFDARLFREYGLRFDQSLASNEDWDCWMRLFALRPTVMFVKEKLALYRLHSDSKTRDRAGMRRSFLQAIDKQLRLQRHDGELRAILTAKKRAISRLYRDCVLPWSMVRASASAARALVRADWAGLESLEGKRDWA